jgi:hypothetical protein
MSEQKSMLFDFDSCLDDVALAQSILEHGDKNGGKISDAAIVFTLRNILKMKYYPVAVKYFFDEEELDDFKQVPIIKNLFIP